MRFNKCSYYVWGMCQVFKNFLLIHVWAMKHNIKTSTHEPTTQPKEYDLPMLGGLHGPLPLPTPWPPSQGWTVELDLSLLSFFCFALKFPYIYLCQYIVQFVFEFNKNICILSIFFHSTICVQNLLRSINIAIVH